MDNVTSIPKKDSVADRFNREAGAWEKSYSKARYNIISLELVQRFHWLQAFVEKRKENDELELLDVGCGTGNVLSNLLDGHPSWNGTGIDLSSGMIEICQERGLGNAHFFHCDLAKTNDPFEGKTFDVIYLMGVVGYIEDLPAFWAILDKALKPGGVLVFTHGRKDSWSRKLQNTILGWLGKEYFFDLYTPKEIRETLPENLYETKRDSLCYASGFLGPLSIAFSHFWQKVFRGKDPLSLALTDIVAAEKKPEK